MNNNSWVHNKLLVYDTVWQLRVMHSAPWGFLTFTEIWCCGIRCLSFSICTTPKHMSIDQSVLLKYLHVTLSHWLSLSKLFHSSGWKTISFIMKTGLFYVAFCFILFWSLAGCESITTEAQVSVTSTTPSSTSFEPTTRSQENSQSTTLKPEVDCIRKIRRFIKNCFERKIRFIEGLRDLFWDVFL